MSQGLQSGLRSWQQLETQVIGWMYEQSQRSLGFGKVTEQRAPWSHWAKAVESDLLRHVFTDLAQHQSITTAGLPIPLPTSSWVELAVVPQ
ncbi:MAG: hypothetical protein HC790_01715 [Acaryochloridaceae cyanobacterium CSU_3_4]|nr:hypothetical protein [Acaryochloridaceae cyanobacterium CSU_3_4]